MPGLGLVTVVIRQRAAVGGWAAGGNGAGGSAVGAQDPTTPPHERTHKHTRNVCYTYAWGVGGSWGRGAVRLTSSLAKLCSTLEVQAG